MTKALITGASAGIGEALAFKLAERQIDLILAGRDEERLGKIAERLSPQVKVQVIAGDLAKPTDRQKLIAMIHREVPDLVINNAGFGLYGDILSYETAEQVEMIDVNVTALLELTVEAGRALVSAKKSGIILNVSSVAATPVMPLRSVYGATKAFVSQLSESLDFEWRPLGIRVLTSCPGMVETRFQQRATGHRDHQKIRGSSKAMTAEFAASEILKQIDSGQRVHTFNFRYRWLTFLCRYLLPKSLVAAATMRELRQRVGRRSLILLSKNNENS